MAAEYLLRFEEGDLGQGNDSLSKQDSEKGKNKVCLKHLLKESIFSYVPFRCL